MTQTLRHLVRRVHHLVHHLSPKKDIQHAYTHNELLERSPAIHATMLYTLRASPCLRRVTTRAYSASALTSAEKLVILGSGWGGYEVLRRVDKKRYGALRTVLYIQHCIPHTWVDVTVVSPVNYFNFTPLLASAAIGTIEFRCATEAVSALCQLGS